MDMGIPGDVYLPGGGDADGRLRMTRRMGIGAHQDDLEILAIDGILAGYDDPADAFTGVVVTNGANSPRTGRFAEFTPEAMVTQRALEQRTAADIGRYNAVVQLGHPSDFVKDGEPDVVDDLDLLLRVCRPDIIYTHAPTDKHDTHVATLARVIEAVQGLPPDERPDRVYGVEVWRDLDWLPDAVKVVFDCSRHEALQRSLLEAFESQIEGGKHYERAALGRRQANATYLDSHAVDGMTLAVYGVDLTPVALPGGPSLEAFCERLIMGFGDDVRARIRRTAIR